MANVKRHNYLFEQTLTEARMGHQRKNASMYSAITIVLIVSLAILSTFKNIDLSYHGTTLSDNPISRSLYDASNTVSSYFWMDPFIDSKPTGS